MRHLTRCLGLLRPWRASAPHSGSRGLHHLVRLGQPHPLTHPHLLKHPEEVNKGLPRSEFAGRRERLAEAVRAAAAEERSEAERHLVVVPAAHRVFMYDNIPYPFRQNTDYRYLTGGLEPDCALVMDVRRDFHTSYLFVRDPDPKEEMWEGPRTSPDAQSAHFFGVENCFPIGELSGMLKKYGKEANGEFMLWYDYLKPRSEKVHSIVMDFMQGFSFNKGVNSPRNEIHKLRLIKSQKEAGLMRKSCNIASEAMKEAMIGTKSMIEEMEVHAAIEHSCRARGAQALAYPPVVAAGANSTIVHYTQSAQAIKEGSMVLVDAGCDFHGYTSDLTRTWPSHGSRFTEPQRVLYEAVLATQLDLLELLTQRTTRRTTVDSLFYDMLDILSRRLHEAGVVKPGELDGANRKLKVRGYCPHHVSHYLGMDVHDCTTVSKDVDLRPGMVITLEPGVYIPIEDRPSHKVLAVREEFRGLGVRIEDDVLITETGHEVLTDRCPKSVDEVEELCITGQSRKFGSGAQTS